MLKLRNSEERDITELQQLEAEAAQRFALIPELAVLAQSGVTDTETHQQSIRQNLAWLIENTHGEIMGFCYARLLADSLYLAEISSHPRARGCGVGAQLLTHVREVASEYQRAGVLLTTYCDVPWNAPWYNKQGFVVLNEVLPGSEPDQIMQQQQAAGLMLLPRCIMWAPALKKR